MRNQELIGKRYTSSLCKSLAQELGSSNPMKSRPTFSPSALRVEVRRRQLRSSSRTVCSEFAKSAKTASSAALSAPAPRVTPHRPDPHGVTKWPPRIKPSGPVPAQSHGPLPASCSASVAFSAAATAAALSTTPSAAAPAPTTPEPKWASRSWCECGSISFRCCASCGSCPRTTLVDVAPSSVAENAHGADGSEKRSVYLAPQSWSEPVSPRAALQLPTTPLLRAPCAPAESCFAR
mmetsp:Transcript_46888/g.101841  ORF Transcript_46888/g.101841 Transcript_46888/m.101841 type:complete len:236 (+) Transcript_46888:422-1129(+)